MLGAALMDENILTQLITELEADMFYSEQNRAVYTQMAALFAENEAVDVVTLVDALAQDPAFQGADDAKIYVARLAETVPALSNVDSYIRIDREKYQTRRLIEAARTILQQSAEESDADMLLERAEQKIYDIRSGKDNPASRPSRSPSWMLSPRCKSSAAPTGTSSPASPPGSPTWTRCSPAWAGPTWSSWRPAPAWARPALR